MEDDLLADVKVSGLAPATLPEGVELESGGARRRPTSSGERGEPSEDEDLAAEPPKAAPSKKGATADKAPKREIVMIEVASGFRLDPVWGLVDEASRTLVLQAAESLLKAVLATKPVPATSKGAPAKVAPAKAVARGAARPQKASELDRLDPPDGDF